VISTQVKVIGVYRHLRDYSFDKTRRKHEWFWAVWRDNMRTGM